jgi:hypothetical protein
LRAFRRVFALLITTTAAVSIVEVGTASALRIDTLTYTVGNLPSGPPFQIYYTSGVNSAFGGVLTVSSGSVAGMGVTTNAMFLRASRGPVNATVVHFVQLGSGPIVGTASLPAGATAFVNDQLTNKTYKLTTGGFTIPTATGLGAKPPAGRSRTVRCQGTRRSCTARVSIAGGASNRRLLIKLTDTNLRLTSVTVAPKRSRSAYVLTSAHFALGGSEYVVTLNAVKSNPKGAHIVLRFGS